jgi:hypothetical protein
MNYSRTKLLEIFDIGLRVGKINLARKKFMLNFAIGIILSKNVHASDVVSHFDPNVELASHVRTAERFFNEYQLDYIQLSVLLLCFLPPGRIHIAIDRTNWKFGAQNINFLTITALCGGVGVPLLFELLDKKGNSNTSERKLLFKKLLRILPAKQLAGFTADREFIGQEWYNFLVTNKIPFYIRIKSNTRVQLNGVNFHAANFALGKRKRFFDNIRVQSFRLKLATKIIGHEKDTEDRYLLILTNADVEKAIDIYRSRWSIEVFFQSIKKRGFNLENTHLIDLPRLKKLFAIVCLAFCACLNTGLWKHDKIKPMKKKKNGYKPFSFFRYGLDELRKVLLHSHKLEELVLQIFENLLFRLKENYSMWSNLNFILRL